MRTPLVGHHPVFHDLGEAVDDLLHGAGKDIDAAHDHHVVDAAQHAALEEHEAVVARRIPGRSHEVTRAIANHGAAESSERGQDELGQFAIGRRLAGFDRQELRQELAFDDVQSLSVRRGVAPRVRLPTRRCGRSRAHSRPSQCAAARRGSDPPGSPATTMHRMRQRGHVDLVLGTHFGQVLA